MSRLYLSNPCALFRHFRARCCGRSRRPAFPVPFRCKGPMKMQQPGRDRAAGMRRRARTLRRHSGARQRREPGIHTPWREWVREMLVGFHSTTFGCGYGFSGAQLRTKARRCAAPRNDEELLIRAPGAPTHILEASEIRAHRAAGLPRLPVVPGDAFFGLGDLALELEHRLLHIAELVVLAA